jgi:hypothetical protein
MGRSISRIINYGRSSSYYYRLPDTVGYYCTVEEAGVAAALD